MGLVATRLALIHLCTVQRNANAGTTNGRGNPNPPDWQPHITSVMCRFYAAPVRETEHVEEAGVIAVANMKLLVPLGTDVTERDRISAITCRGASLAAGPFEIRAIIPRRSFLELTLVRLGV
jgi:hypothetical protein